MKKSSKEKLSGEHLSILRNAFLFSLSRRGWSGRAKVRKLEQEAKIITNAASENIGVTKRLIKCEQFDAINEHLGNIYQWCCDNSMPAVGIKKGFAFVKRTIENQEGEEVDLIEVFEDQIQHASSILEDELVPAFLKEYPNAKMKASLSKAQGGLGDLFLESDYPTVEELQESFGIEHSWFALSVPDELPDEIRARENKKLRESFQQAQEEIRVTLRTAFSELLSEAMSRLTGTGEFEGKQFRNGSLNRFESFVNSFSAKDITEDGELKKLVLHARSLIKQVPDAEIIRDHAKLAALAAEKFTGLKTAISGMIANKPERLFAVED